MPVAFSSAPTGPIRIDTDRLRLEHPIADLVARYGIELRRSGASFTGRCPFHLDRGRPNLTVYPRSGRFVCYRCGVHGDAISFVQQIENLTFREAATRLGGQPAPTLPRPSIRRPAQRHASLNWPARRLDAPQLAVLAAALDLYRNRLMNDSRALAYLASRGFERELVDRFHVGYAAGDELVPYLVWRDLPVAAARRVGLLDVNRHEHLAGRLVFPEIRQGQPIWFVGRLLDDDERVPKYLGLPGREPLLGWDAASRDLRGVCVVEGPLDLLALRQWGLPCLSICGTRLHPETLAELGRWERLYIVLDADDAGEEATLHLIDAFGSRAIRVTLPPGMDPANLAERPDGEALFRAAIRTAALSHLSGSTDAGSTQPLTAAVKLAQ